MIPLESDTPPRTLAEDVGLIGRSFLKELDFEIDEWNRLLDLARRLKIHHHAGTETRLLEGRNLALVFSKESTRTRCAFEVAAHTQGAHVTYLDPIGSQLGHKESLRDTGAVLGRMFDGIEYRGFAQHKADELARAAGVPVWNGLSDQWHPTQALCDTFTMLEQCDKPAHEITVAYLGDAHNNVANSLLISGAMMGFDVRMVAPDARWNDTRVADSAKSIAHTTGARITQTADVTSGVAGADFVYTDVWLSMGEHESLWDDRINLFLPYRVTAEVMRATGNPDTKFMHCLPALHDRQTELGDQIYRRTGLDGVEVTNEVFRSTHSIVFDQAENRLHTIKAILVATLGS